MRILYVGRLWDGSTSLERMCLLQELNCTTIPFDVTSFAQMGSHIERSLAHRIYFGRGVSALNRSLLVFARSQQFDAVWVDKGILIYPETLRSLRKRSARGLAIHYTPDAQILQHKSRHVMRAMADYDLLVTTKPFETGLYKAAGARDVLLVLQGYGRQFFPRAADGRFQAEISFIGHCQPHYARRLKSVAGLGCDLRIWGQRWPRYARWRPWAAAHVRGDAIWGPDYPVALASTKIALGLLSKYIPETTTTRSFEIPAMGTFMLAERTEDHLALFEEGREAEFFASDEEMKDKIRFYLKNDGARAAIAAAGRQRCVSGNYDAKSQLKRVLDHLSDSGFGLDTAKAFPGKVGTGFPSGNA